MIDTTYHYVRLYNQVYKPQEPIQHITKIASTKQEQIDLMNDGWSFIKNDGDDWYFKKQKIC